MSGLRDLFRSGPRVSVLRLSGAIGAARFGRGLDIAGMAPLIERAFAPRRLSAVALAINSPGGAPTQSALIAEQIRDFANEKNVPVLAFCEDVAASGGYMLACAADEIYADANSVVGSIGVVSGAFGFHEAMQRLGVERRLQTAGVSKARMDPFLPVKPEDQAWLAEIMRQMHANFIGMVKTSRGDRLRDSEELFTGEVWLGERAAELGLVDGVARMRPMLRARFGNNVRIDTIAQKRGFFQRMTGAGVDRSDAAPETIGAGVVRAAVEELEHCALWGRYGL